MNQFLHKISFANSKKILLFTLTALFLIGCLPFHAYIFMVPDEKDIRRFKHEEVKHAKVCFEFNKRPVNKPITVTNWTHKEPLISASLEKFLIENKAKHFLVIKNDSIVFEYINKKSKDDDQPYPSFSIAKTFVSASLGVAIKEGYIGSVNDLAKKYLPELNYHKNFDSLTINHLLNQYSGLRSELNGISNANYGKIEKILKQLHFNYKPGERLEYVNINTILIGLIIERVTGQYLHNYFSDKIWSKIGTCDSTVWEFDYKTKHTRSFSCFGASPRDYAKFGRLFMNKGKWGDQQVIDSNWVLTCTSPVNGLGKNIGYNNAWFIGEPEIGDFMAIGMFRQQIYVNPKENVVIVSLMKFNTTILPYRWWEILRQIAKQV